MKIRTITAGLTLDASCSRLAETIDHLARIQAEFEDAGYVVQTARIATQPIDELVGQDAALLRGLGRHIADISAARAFQFISLGPVNSNGGLALVDTLPELLADFEMLNASVSLVSHGEVDEDACQAATRVIRRLAEGTPAGIGNFRFAATASCPPGIPFFPSAYHDGGEPTLAMGLESADGVQEAFSRAQGLSTAGEQLVLVFNQYLTPVAELGQKVASRLGWRWLGIDTSPAPLGQVSIARAFETLGLDAFGAAGTLSVAAMTTRSLEQVRVKRCGFSGLMFPVLEDAVLGLRNAEGRFGIQNLLLYSTVCGTGLDTVPIPGDTPPSRIEGLLRDVASLSVRLSKPLSARLFPVPGKRAGEMTTFDSPYLTNTVVMEV